MSQVFLGLMLAFTLNTPFTLDVHPNGQLFSSIQCVQCGHWYIPTSDQQLTCPCDYVD